MEQVAFVVAQKETALSLYTIFYTTTHTKMLPRLLQYLTSYKVYPNERHLI